jgi:hypothetical protein
MKRIFSLPVLVFAALAAFQALPVSGETTIGPAITTVPVTISASGVYHFTKDLVYSPSTGTAINITASDVVIDLNGFTLAGTAGAGTSSNGIVALGHNRITIKNGTVKGFADGVALGGDNTTVTDVLVDSSFRIGIRVAGAYANISGNHISATGGSAVSSVLDATGISLTGTYGNVSGNLVDHTGATDVAKHYAIGIDLLGCSNVSVAGNRVLSVSPAAPASAVTTGISADPSAASDNLIFLNNIVTGSEVGFDLSGASSGSYGDNTTSGVATGYYSGGTGMSDIGGNN